MHGERVSEEVVGARKGSRALRALPGSRVAMLGEHMSLEMIFPSGLVGTLRALHASAYL